jgi:eukaryotic-like serine/threonine-protein kinase
MDLQRRLRIESLYHAADECEPHRRAEFLAQICANDETLRREVERLLHQSGSSDDLLLERPVWENAESLLDSGIATRLLPGAQLGPYTIEVLLGTGGMGQVYRARDRRLHRTVALKVLSLDQPADPEYQRRLRQEARASSALNHPNIITVYDIGCDNGIDYIAMEYVDGGTLTQAFSVREPSITGKLLLGVQIAQAIAAAHRSGIVHRDLKPRNIMVTGGGQIKVLDFGLARRAENTSVREDESTRMSVETRTGVIAGTIAYMSPEQAQGLKADTRSDIFSFGAVLYEMFTGSRPFTGNSSLEVVAALLEREPVNPALLRPDLPKQLSPILRKALAKKPAERYQRMQELSDELESLRQRLEAPASAAWSAVQRTRRLWASLVVVMVLIAIAVFALTGRGRTFGRHSLSSIAVLPFENLSTDAAQESFSDGMTETLITELAGIRALKVISRASVMQYKKTHKPLKQIGNELGVDAVIEGSALRAGSRIRITAQLIEVSSDHHLWASDYDRDFQDVLSLNKEVAQEIAREVGATLTPGEQKRLVASRPVNPAAMAAYLRGLYEYNRGDVTKSAAEGREAIKRDPQLAQAYELLGMSLLTTADFGQASYSSIMQEARTSLRRALEIEPDRGVAVSTMGWGLMVADHDWEQAEKWLRRGYELDPSTGTNYSTLLAARGHNDEAIEVTRKAIEIDPANPNVLAGAGINYRLVRRYKDAIALCKKALEVDPAGGGFASRHLLLAYLLDGQFDAAFELFLSLRAGPSDPMSKLTEQMRSEYNRSGWAAVWRMTLRQFPDDRSSLAMRIRLGAQLSLGNNRQALDELEALEKAGESEMIFLEDPRFDPIRAEPRFKTMLKRVGYPEAMWR